MELVIHGGMFRRHFGGGFPLRFRGLLVDLYLQFGFGMIEHCKQLASNWGGATVVLSPRDLRPTQLENLATTIRTLPSGAVWLDPQFYVPRSDHTRLRSHDFWPKDSEYGTSTFWTSNGLSDLLTKLRELNDRLGSASMVLPGVLTRTVDDLWLNIQRNIIETAKAVAPNHRLTATIALNSDALRNDDQVAELLEAAASWSIPSYYLVFEPPNGDYLVKDPSWLANALDVVAGLRLLGSSVLVGYANHQMLVAAAAAATGICSGTWLNVRAFTPDKFQLSEDDEIKQRATWYYCPQSLSEYRLVYLDIAQKAGVLSLMAPPQEFDGGYASNLFSGPKPTSVGYSEQSSFRHYLHALRAQARSAVRDSFDETVTELDRSLDRASQLSERLARAGVRAEQRSSAPCVDAARTALSLLRQTRGALLRRRWTELRSG